MILLLNKKTAKQKKWSWTEYPKLTEIIINSGALADLHKSVDAELVTQEEIWLKFETNESNPRK